MENENIWKIGLVVLVLIAVFGVYYNNRGLEEVTGETIGNLNEIGVFSKVGIGTLTPSNKLDVVGKVKVTDRVITPMVEIPTAEGTGYTGIFNYDSDTNTITDSLRINSNKNIALIIDETNNYTDAALVVFKDGPSNTPLLKVREDGNVGIGTSSPSVKLDVVGDVKGTRLCIGNDCKNSWPSGGSVSGVNLNVETINDIYGKNLRIGSEVNKINVGINTDPSSATLHIKHRLASMTLESSELNPYTDTSTFIKFIRSTDNLDYYGKIGFFNVFPHEDMSNNLVIQTTKKDSSIVLDADNDIIIKKMNFVGEGELNKYYLCVDGNGKVFRSGLPCV